MHRSAPHTPTPGMTRKTAQAAKAFIPCALLLLAAAHASGQHRHGRDSEPGARSPRGNQTTAVALPAPPQERPPAVGTLQARGRAWLANQTLALAVHGPVAAWDTSAETDLAGVFEDAAYFNEDLNAGVPFLPFLPFLLFLPFCLFFLCGVFASRPVACHAHCSRCSFLPA